jgi:hypothetical protein
MKIFLKVVILISHFILLTKCDVIRLFNVKIKWTNRVNQTDFEIRSSLDKRLSLTNAWLSFGFSSQMMVI